MACRCRLVLETQLAITRAAGHNTDRMQLAKRVRCRHVPVCTNPAKDCATPLDQLVSKKTSARMRKRASRAASATRAGHQEPLKDFPWNDACRKALAGIRARIQGHRLGRPPCEICLAKRQLPSSRQCQCAVQFAGGTDRAALTSFVKFTRACTTPFYRENDPEDQRTIQVSLLQALDGAGNDSYRAQVRFSAVAALSGRPEALESLAHDLHHSASHGALKAGISRLVDQGAFFRGGQPHGSLKKADVASAVAEFCVTHVDFLAGLLQQWVEAPDLERRRLAVQRFALNLEPAGKVLQGGPYWRKRFLDILLLADTVRAADLDFLVASWPLGHGTLEGLQMIWPACSKAGDARECLRALQRSLGSGTRRVPMVCISAFLCFWKRARQGNIPWTVQRPEARCEARRCHKRVRQHKREK